MNSLEKSKIDLIINETHIQMIQKSLDSNSIIDHFTIQK